MATQIVGTLNNSYEAKLMQGGLTEPLTTYLADPVDAERFAAGFPVLLSSDTAGNLATSYPPATWPGALAKVGSGVTWALYFCTGSAWVLK